MSNQVICKYFYEQNILENSFEKKKSREIINNVPWIQPTIKPPTFFLTWAFFFILSIIYFSIFVLWWWWCVWEAHVRHEWPPALFRLNVSIWRLGPTYLAFSESPPHFYLFIRFLFATVSWVRSPSFYLNQILPRVRPIFALVDHPTRHVCFSFTVCWCGFTESWPVGPTFSSLGPSSRVELELDLL